MEVSLLFLYPLGYFFFFEFNGQGSEHIHCANPFHLQLFNFFNNKIREVRVGRIIYGIFCFIFVVVALKIYNFELFQDCLQRHIQTTRQKSKIDFFDRALNTSLVYIGMIVIPMNVLLLLQISKMVGKLSVLVNHLQYMQPPLRRKQSGWHTFPNV